MAKGKYGARAANRLVQTDNELLKEKSAECERLKGELNRANQELHLLRTAMGSEVTARAQDQASRRIREARDECAAQVAAVEERWRSEGRYIADKLWDYFVGPSRKGHIPRSFVTDVIPRLIPASEVDAFINDRLDEGGQFQSNRRTRRHAMRNIQRNSAREVAGGKEVEKLAVAAAFGSERASEILEDPSRWDGTPFRQGEWNE